METLLLNKDEVGSLIDLDLIQAAVEDGYRHFNSGEVVQPPFMALYVPNDPNHAGMDIKAGTDMGSGYMGLKASSGGYKNNPALGLPTGMNTVLLFDANTSALKCIMDGTWITGCRTGAAGAISTKYLARKDAKILGMIGAGNQARRQLRAVRRVRDIQEVYVWDAFPDTLQKFVEEMTAETGLPIHACQTAEEAVRPADVLYTVTIGRMGPVVKREWIKPGTHICCIGADMPDKQEMHSDVFKGAKIVNDSIDLCIKNGETHHPVEEGIIKVEDIHAEIGEIILGKKPGRENDEEITIFDTVGMAIQDIMMAKMLFETATAKGMGTKYEFFK